MDQCNGQHKWTTRYIEIDGTDSASGMNCAECNAELHQDEVEDAINDVASLKKKIHDMQHTIDQQSYAMRELKFQLERAKMELDDAKKTHSK